MECLPDHLPAVRPRQVTASVYWLPAPAHWVATLRSWVETGKTEAALPWLIRYRREAWAQRVLGDIRWRDPSNAHKAFRWLRHAVCACEDDDVEVVRLGTCYAKGIGTQRNPVMAWYWLRRAAQASVAEAVEALGEIESADLLIPANRIRATMWFAICCTMISDQKHSEHLQEKMFELAKDLSARETDWIFDCGWKWMVDNWTE